MKPNALNIGAKVQIASHYPDPALRGQKAIVIDLPDKKHRDEYLIRLTDGQAWSGRPLWIPGSYLQVI